MDSQLSREELEKEAYNLGFKKHKIIRLRDEDVKRLIEKKQTMLNQKTEPMETFPVEGIEDLTDLIADPEVENTLFSRLNTIMNEKFTLQKQIDILESKEESIRNEIKRNSQTKLIPNVDIRKLLQSLQGLSTLNAYFNQLTKIVKQLILSIDEKKQIAFRNKHDSECLQAINSSIQNDNMSIQTCNVKFELLTNEITLKMTNLEEVSKATQCSDIKGKILKLKTFKFEIINFMSKLTMYL
jgi:hypothetical protein